MQYGHHLNRVQIHPLPMLQQFKPKKTFNSGKFQFMYIFLINRLPLEKETLQQLQLFVVFVAIFGIVEMALGNN